MGATTGVSLGIIYQSLLITHGKNDCRIRGQSGGNPNVLLNICGVGSKVGDGGECAIGSCTNGRDGAE